MIVKVPYKTKEIESTLFENNTEVEEIILPDTIEYIHELAFSGCTNLKKINLPESLINLGGGAFHNCTSLEEITIPKSIKGITAVCFYGCTNLKKVNFHDDITYIDGEAFYGCENLEELNLPKNIEYIDKCAFFGCKKIKNLYIRGRVKHIKNGAFAHMDSLEKIIVDKENEMYLTIENGKALVSVKGMLIQYAIGCKTEEFKVDSFERIYKNIFESFTSKERIYNIGELAFAGSKYLKKLYLPAKLDSFCYNSFEDCPNLKNLEIYHTRFGDSLSIPIYKSLSEKVYMPFENIKIGENIKVLCSNIQDLFLNAKNVMLPDTLEKIDTEVFTKSKDLKILKIPNGTQIILPNTFNDSTILDFEGCNKISAKDFSELKNKFNSFDCYKYNSKDLIRIITLKNKEYIVKIGKNVNVEISEEEIEKLSKTSKYMKNKPEEIIIHILRLIDLNPMYNEVYNKLFKNPKLRNIFEELKKDGYDINDIIKRILNTNGYDEFLFSALLMNFDKYGIAKTLSYYTLSINRFFRNFEINNESSKIDLGLIIDYSSLLEKYKKYDTILYNEAFIYIPFDNLDLFIKEFNKNIKHLIKNSGVLLDRHGDNLNDLIKLCNSLGVLSNDSILSQKMSTFLNEKIFLNGIVSGDNIHRTFADLKPREEIDLEFIEFFVDNYNKLFEIEKEKSGFISRVYNNFREISNTSTSHRGSQRHLKVTINKCLDYFLNNTFDGVTEENKPLATLLQEFYSERYTLEAALDIVNESKKAPRNIFGENDLKENNKDFSYEWLPKQDYRNLVLGKYCNCCAHIFGAGAGIMRASMTNDCCQNLVIKKDGTIIAKMTIFVNKEEGYAVFNTAEVSSLYRTKENLDKVYNAFIRGTKDFLKTYNENNDIPITNINIGGYRNTLSDYLEKQTELLPVINYSNFGYVINNVNYGTYEGDARNSQYLVLKK